MKRILLFLLIFISLSCCQTPPDSTKSESEVTENKVSTQQEKTQPKIEEKKFFQRKPLWVEDIEEWKKSHGDRFKKINIVIHDGDFRATFSQLEKPTEKQFTYLKGLCTSEYNLIDYFWFGEEKITQLYGLCIKKKDSTVNHNDNSSVIWPQQLQ